MIEHFRRPDLARLLAVLIVVLLVGGAAIAVFADDDGSGPAAELAGAATSPEPASSTPISPGPGKSETGGAPRGQREQGRNREQPNRENAGEPAAEKGGGNSVQASAQAQADDQKPQTDSEDAEQVVEELLGGNGSDRGRGSSQSDLPPEVAALLQGSDEQGSENPPPALEELLEAGSGGG